MLIFIRTYPMGKCIADTFGGKSVAFFSSLKFSPFCTFPRLGKVLRKIMERENVEKSDILSTYIFSNITNCFPFLIKKLSLVQSGLEAQPLHEYYM